MHFFQFLFLYIKEILPAIIYWNILEAWWIMLNYFLKKMKWKWKSTKTAFTCGEYCRRTCQTEWHPCWSHTAGWRCPQKPWAAPRWSDGHSSQTLLGQWKAFQIEIPETQKNKEIIALVTFMPNYTLKYNFNRLIIHTDTIHNELNTAYLDGKPIKGNKKFIIQ